MEITFVLEEIQVSPLFGGGIVSFKMGILRPLIRIDVGKHSPFMKIDRDIQPLGLGIELQRFDIPGLFNTKGFFEQRLHYDWDYLQMNKL